MEKLYGAFFCTSPYQVLTSIVLKIALNKDADIYIVSLFDKAEKYADNLRKLNIFRRVKLIDSATVERHKKAKSKFLMHLGIVLQYFNIEKVGKEILFLDTRYDYFFASSKAFVPRIAYFYCTKHRIVPEMVYYDDGEGSYYFKDRTEPSIMDKIARRIVIGKKSVIRADKLYLHDPQLYKEINGNYSERELIEIPRIINNEDIKEIISKVFEIKKTDLIREKTIIIDMIKEVKYGPEEVEKINNTYQTIQDYFTNDEIIIKKHPADKHAMKIDIHCYANNGIPFECLCTQLQMQSKVLVGVYSTALVMPKILLDQEPKVIMLYKLFKRMKQTEEARFKQDRFYKACQARYRAKDRFFIPESFEELQKILIQMKDEID